jgi:lipoyl(octanoyl) transferase
MEWQVMIDATGHAGASNMALDALLLEDAARTARATLRLYRWSPSCLSFGRNEPALARYDRAAIEQRGWDVVRRPTGGRAVWHEQEVTYAVAAPIAAFGSLQQSYCAIHERLAAALRTLGAPAQLAPTNDRPASLAAGACFASPVGGEVTVHGRKVVGSAQVRLGSALLQHGSILLGGSQENIQAVSRQPLAIGSATALSHVLGREVTFDEVANAIVSEWPSVLTPTAPSRPLPSSTVFSDPSWTWRR